MEWLVDLQTTDEAMRHVNSFSEFKERVVYQREKTYLSIWNACARTAEFPDVVADMEVDWD